MRILTINPRYIRVQLTGQICAFSAPPGKHFRADSVWGGDTGRRLQPVPYHLGSPGVAVIDAPWPTRASFRGWVEPREPGGLGSVWIGFSTGELSIGGTRFAPPPGYHWDFKQTQGGTYKTFTLWSAEAELFVQRACLQKGFPWYAPLGENPQPASGVRLFLNPGPPPA